MWFKGSGIDSAGVKRSPPANSRQHSGHEILVDASKADLLEMLCKRSLGKRLGEHIGRLAIATEVHILEPSPLMALTNPVIRHIEVFGLLPLHRAAADVSSTAPMWSHSAL